jgi:large subunit ribosomal protein L6
MSRIGKKPVLIPSGVTVLVQSGVVTIKGPKGELTLSLPEGVIVTEGTGEKGAILEVTVQEGGTFSAIWGTTRAHLQNMVKGVTEGWNKQLELNGVGYRMNLQGTTLILNLGFSHDIKYPIPTGLKAELKDNVLTLSGVSRQQVGAVAAEIRAMKKPEPYKGKGFKYVGEVIRRKLGKQAKSE